MADNKERFTLEHLDQVTFILPDGTEVHTNDPEELKKLLSKNKSKPKDDEDEDEDDA